jgi:hypothetical protein
MEGGSRSKQAGWGEQYQAVAGTDNLTIDHAIAPASKAPNANIAAYVMHRTA